MYQFNSLAKPDCNADHSKNIIDTIVIMSVRKVKWLFMSHY